MSQCRCCASPLGEPIKLRGTERIICSDCLGFISRWAIELFERINAPEIATQIATSTTPSPKDD